MRAEGETRAVLDPLGHGPEAPSPEDLQAAQLGFCGASSQGAWALVPERVRVSPEERGLRVRYALVHYDRQGHRAWVYPAMPDEEGAAVSDAPYNFVRVPGDTRSAVASPTLYDYDHDGEQEVVLPLTTDYHEGPSWEAGRVWSLREGGVFLYERARDFKVADVTDADHDGRPDLVLYGPYLETSETCGAGFEVSVTGPKLLAHALADGGFSVNDGVAQAYARTRCPARPAVIVARDANDPQQVDDAKTALNVVCARLWGATEADVRAELRRGCPPASPEAPCATCTDLELLEHFARLPPPLQLGAQGR